MEFKKTMDATVWAKEFMKKFENRKEEIDEDLMVGWFANAIMTGYDTNQRSHEILINDVNSAVKDACA